MHPILSHIPRSELRAALLSLAVGVGLMTIKFIAYFITRSAAVFSDAVESIANVAASSVAFYSLIVAHWPADRDHPYGHGKVEFLSAWFEGGMIGMAAIFILIRTIDAIVRGESLVEEKLDSGLALMAFAMLVNGGLGWYLIRTGRRQHSMTLEADGHHLMSDAYTSIAVLAALGLVWLTGRTWLDPAAALLMAGYIGWMASVLLRRAAAGLMDRQDVADVSLVEGILNAHIGRSGREPRICSFHKLRLRHSGRYHWVEFHIMVPPQLSIEQGHAIASAIEYEIEQALHEGNATAHVEPCADEPCDLEDLGVEEPGPLA